MAKGSFVQNLMLTEIATGWAAYAPLLEREQRLLTEALSELGKLLSFALLGLGTDNDNLFMNEVVRDHCEKGGIEFVRPSLSQEDRASSSRRMALWLRALSATAALSRR